MQYTKLCIFAAAVVISTSTASKIFSPSHQQDESFSFNPEKSFPDNILSCGGVITSSQGGISYKAFEASSINERCIWTVRAPNATYYEVLTRSLGQEGSVIISGFGLRGHINHTNARIDPNGFAQVIPLSNMLVITFYTGDRSTGLRGFTLEFKAFTDTEFFGESTASPGSTDVIAAANVGYVKHPSSAEALYSSFELSVILFAPLNNGYNPNKKIDVTYIRNGMEQGCNDEISVFMFDVNKWVNMGRLCGGVESELISHRDMIMFVFESDGNIEGSGFHFAYSQCTK